MPKPAYKDLGISSKEYEEALLLERLFKLVKKNPCSTCLLKKPTHVDLDRYELLCTACSKRCASKLQIGKGLISVGDLERLEQKYDKSKRKEHESSKHKKHRHKTRSPSPASYDSYDSYKKTPKYEPLDFDSTDDYRRKPKERTKKKDSHRYPSHDYYPEPFESYPHHYGATSPGYPSFYPEEPPTPHHKSRKDKKEKSRDRRDRGRDAGFREFAPGMDYDAGRDFETPREPYATAPSYAFPQPSHHSVHSRYRDLNESYQPEYKYPGRVTRNFTAYDYVNPTRRDVPGMVGLLANQGRGRDVVRNQLALPPPADKRYPAREMKPQALALTNGFHAFRSLPNIPRDETLSNNPFARNYDAGQAYNFAHMREALNPPKAQGRYTEPFHPPNEFSSTKQGNVGFPEPGPNYYNRF